MLCSAACGTESSQKGAVRDPDTDDLIEPRAHSPGGSAETGGACHLGCAGMMPNPNGDGSMVPCEGTICTNPNHGAGDNPDENGGAVMPNPNGDGSDVDVRGTICTNPNHGAGDNPDENGGAVMPELQR